MKMKIGFNKPHLTGKETHYIYEAVKSLHLSGNGVFTKKSHQFFQEKYGFKNCLLTSSCTDALEMSSILIGIEPGDEVIIPSYTFVSTANAFVLRGAKIVFADSLPNHPNMDVSKIEALITSKTKAIVPVHYAGMACDMDEIMRLAEKYNLFVVEDAAQAVDSYYKGKPLGSIGHLATFSFHETKNIISGEGGMLVVNDDQLFERAEVIWEKGTNRSAFFRGEVNKYGWVDVGSSYLPSEVVAAFLYAQLENIEDIQNRRKEIWQSYYKGLHALEVQGKLKLPIHLEHSTNNAHMFYVLCESFEKRTALINYLKTKGILSVFHYLSLHKSPFYKEKHDGRSLAMSDYFEHHLLRLPFFYDLTQEEQDLVIQEIHNFYKIES
ncbi:MAG: dTDP-4-amino-4,6-dideoxygalactose transaminase [Flavobacteriales bacterium]|jgi:dTDP-4-amino-4,6-dideoxygalactose transaminase|nr:dTDP-4-amino-4,6-dideoxygalactose transaminase [Flavobacteriales bacterium]